MAQEIVIKVWCDVCAQDLMRVEGDPVIVAFEQQEARRLDLCEPHRAEYVAPLLTLYASESSSPVEPPGSRAVVSEKPRTRTSEPGKPKRLRTGIYPCLLCDKALSADSSIRSHYDVKHGIRLDRDLMGHECPLCGHRALSGAGLDSHLSSDHDGLTVPAAILAAEKAGDEYGVVAAVRKRLDEAARP